MGDEDRVKEKNGVPFKGLRWYTTCIPVVAWKGAHGERDLAIMHKLQTHSNFPFIHTFIGRGLKTHRPILVIDVRYT
jgi:hypothetical protein